jgi:hypothetical protein
MTSDWQSLRRLGFLLTIPIHFVLAVVGSMAIGFLPEAFVGHLYYNTGLDPYSPMILVAAGCLGYWVNKKVGHASARWIWVIGVIWLAYGASEESAYWATTSAPSRMQYVMDNFFGRTSACSSSECLAEFFFTTPCAVSIVYSIVAVFGLKSYRRRRLDDSGFPSS